MELMDQLQDVTGVEVIGEHRLRLTFDDGTVSSAFLSWKAFRQLLGMKAGKQAKPDAKPAQAMPIGNAVQAK